MSVDGREVLLFAGSNYLDLAHHPEVVEAAAAAAREFGCAAGGSRLINGTGGQPEAHIAAILSKGGRAITLLPSTAMNGAVSRVVAQHEAGSIVTIPRYFADTVITEHGVARLWGKNHRQRAEELIAVAHPDFRADLRREAQRL